MKADEWAMYQVEEGEDPFAEFRRRWGRDAKEIVIGKKVDIRVPDEVEIKNLTAQPGHVLLR